MSLIYWIPFFIIVIGNIGYHMVAKATPSAAPPFLALSVTYLVSFLLCAAAYVVTGPSLRQDLHTLNWASAAWGLTLVAVEFGYILLYRTGWKISTASLTANVSVALLLAGIGVLFYKDVLLPRQIIGIILCTARRFFCVHKEGDSTNRQLPATNCCSFIKHQTAPNYLFLQTIFFCKLSFPGLRAIYPCRPVLFSVQFSVQNSTSSQRNEKIA